VRQDRQPLAQQRVDLLGAQAVAEGLQRLGPDQIQALLDKWLQVLPCAFTEADRAAGYRYELSVLQAEFSLTQVLDRPVTGRVFFEQVIRDNLDAGHPDQISLIFDRRLIHGRRRSTPGRFRTRVITDGVTPSLHIDYKHTAIKQYHKEGQALRTETTINDTRDFGIGKRLTKGSPANNVHFGLCDQTCCATTGIVRGRLGRRGPDQAEIVSSAHIRPHLAVFAPN